MVKPPSRSADKAESARTGGPPAVSVMLSADGFNTLARRVHVDVELGVGLAVFQLGMWRANICVYVRDNGLRLGWMRC